MTVRGVRASTEPGVQAGRTDTLLALLRLAMVATVVANSLLVAGCAAHPPPPSGVPAAPFPVVRPVAEVLPEALARIAPPELPAGYTLESRAIVATHADSLARSDTLDTHAVLRVVPRGSAIDVTISTFVVHVLPGPTQALPAAVRSVGRFDAAGAVEFEGAGRAGCASIAASAFEATRDLWVKWPAQLGVGDQWGDSASVALCRDGVPLRLILIRRYVVTATSEDTSGSTSGGTPSRLLTIERRSRITLEGRGSIRGDSTTLAGEGTGSATLRLSAASGWLIDGHAMSVLRLTARGTRRTQSVEQQLTLSFRQTGDSTRSP